MQDNPGACQQCCHSLAKEFQKGKFLLSHESKEDFYKSQWQTQQKSVIWLIYRWIFAIFFMTGVIGSWINQFAAGKWFIFLTNWGFTLCMYTGIFGAILVTINYCDKDKSVPQWVLKLYWASYWITLIIATVITLIYWTFLYPTEGSMVYNIWSHAFNSILMIMDHMLVAFPARILHFIYPLSFGIIYALFAMIYYYAGGVDGFGNRYIYPILDWSDPGSAVLTTLGCLLLSIAFSFFHFGLYKLRTFIYNKRSNSQFTLNV